MTSVTRLKDCCGAVAMPGNALVTALPVAMAKDSLSGQGHRHHGWLAVPGLVSGP